MARSDGPGGNAVARPQLNLRLVLFVLAAFAAAVLAFANAAAQIGLRFPLFAPLGGAFYARQVDFLPFEQALQQDLKIAARPGLRLAALERLKSAPLDGRALRNYALHREAIGDRNGARLAFGAGNAVSRRDPSTQLWLTNDAALKNDVAVSFAHFDAAMRTSPGTAQLLVGRMAQMTVLPAAQKAFVPFIRADNPWLSSYVDAAVALPQAREPLVGLFVAAGRAPDVPALRTPYSQLVDTLVANKNISMLKRFYPLLPEARVGDLYSIRLEEDAFQFGYVPVIWDLGQSSERGGAPIEFDGKVALEFFGLPDTRGIAARKLVVTKASETQLVWTIADKSQNLDSSAAWVFECQRGGEVVAVARSANLFNPRFNKASKMALPTGCDAILIQFEIDGGNGRDPARVVFSSIALN